MKDPNLALWQSIKNTLEEIRLMQEKNLIDNARRILPYLTTDDLLQPNDYPELENNPYFRYEEGVLSGIQTVEAALKALHQDDKSSFDSK